MGQKHPGQVGSRQRFRCGSMSGVCVCVCVCALVLDVEVVSSTASDELWGHVQSLDVQHCRRLKLHRWNQHDVVLTTNTHRQLVRYHVIQMHTLVLLVFKCLFHSDLVPSIYFNYFVLNNEIHNYNTRLSQGLHICGPRTSYGQKCIQFKGSSLWNRLPLSLKIPSSVVVFLKNLKNYLSTL